MHGERSRQSAISPTDIVLVTMFKGVGAFTAGGGDTVADK